MKEKLSILAAMLVLLAAVLACGGVKVDSTQIATPAGQPARFLVQCGNETANCVLEANADCPGGYDIFSQSGQLESVSSFHGRYFSSAQAHNRQEFMIQCVGPQGARADKDSVGPLNPEVKD